MSIGRSYPSVPSSSATDAAETCLKSPYSVACPSPGPWFDAKVALTESMELQTYSHEGAEDILEEKGILSEIHTLPQVWEEHGGQHSYSERKAAAAEIGDWVLQEQLDLGPSGAPHNERLTPFLDAYSYAHSVGVEHERKEQMRARWHLMKMQAGANESATLDIDVGVMLYPTDRDCSLRRTRRELEGPFFSEHFPIALPIYVVEYEP